MKITSGTLAAIGDCMRPCRCQPLRPASSITVPGRQLGAQDC